MQPSCLYGWSISVIEIFDFLPAERPTSLPYFHEFAARRFRAPRATYQLIIPTPKRMDAHQLATGVRGRQLVADATERFRYNTPCIRQVLFFTARLDPSIATCGPGAN